ncbi:MAG: IS1182 family transposase [Hyphomicrobiaceae bacterium]
MQFFRGFAGAWHEAVYRRPGRDQITLLPECLDDWADEDNPVRVIEAFVEALELRKIGFSSVDPKTTGRPAYHPAVLLKLYIYGYLNAVQSSRRLEREARCNVEVMWLLGRLVPDHKTIAEFRRTNGPAIAKVCAQFVELCRRLGLLTHASVAIDGSKFKAVNNRDRNFTEAKMKRRMVQIVESVSRYIHQLESADRQEQTNAIVMRTKRLKEKIRKLKDEMDRLEGVNEHRCAEPDKQISMTDPDARSMTTSGRGSGVVGYNVQTAVDTKHHLIVAHVVTTSGSDRSQLAPMSKLTKQVLEVDKLDVVADRGYFSNKQILECADADITVTLPKPQTSNNKLKGLFVKADFRYVPDDDRYVCPAGELLVFVSRKKENDLNYRRYATKQCGGCKLKKHCTRAAQRVVTRWEHEQVLEDVQRRLDEDPEAMRTRRETVEHPFGTIKARMGATHFLMKRLHNVKTEMSLAVLAYNLTRVMNIVGIKPLIAAMRE